MKKIFEYLRLIFFMTGVLIGIQVPSFIDQYGKNLESRLSESAVSLEKFQYDANRHFGGDIARLIEHYQSNPDPIFNDGGDSISSIYRRNLMLRKAYEEFNRNGYSAYIHVFLSPMIEIKNQVWENYTYNIMLDTTAIIFGLSMGIVLSAIAELTVSLLISVGSLLSRQLKPA